MSQKVDEAALGVRGGSSSCGIQDHSGSPWRSVLRSHSTEVVARWATEIVPTKRKYPHFMGTSASPSP